MSDYANIRELLQGFIGKRLVEITQHDEQEWAEGHEAYVCLMFDDGNTINFPVTALGFEITEDDKKTGEGR